jgi:hypothetical protein
MTLGTHRKHGPMALALAACLIAGPALSADAKSPAKKLKSAAAHQGPQRTGERRPNADPSPNPWYALDANKLPFGSSLWWEQMLRENRLTCCN